MSTLEIIALVLVGLGLLELVICLIKPEIVLAVARPLYRRPRLAQFLYLVAGGLVLYFLLQELTIVQIMATILFAGCVMGLGIAPIGTELLEIFTHQVEKKRFWKDYALLWFVWILMLAWTLYALFG